jgi:aryl carrier-like protein
MTSTTRRGSSGWGESVLEEEIKFSGEMGDIGWLSPCSLHKQVTMLDNNPERYARMHLSDRMAELSPAAAAASECSTRDKRSSPAPTSRTRATGHTSDMTLRRTLQVGRQRTCSVDRLSSTQQLLQRQLNSVRMAQLPLLQHGLDRIQLLKVEKRLLRATQLHYTTCSSILCSRMSMANSSPHLVLA